MHSKFFNFFDHEVRSNQMSIVNWFFHHINSIQLPMLHLMKPHEISSLKTGFRSFFPHEQFLIIIISIDKNKPSVKCTLKFSDSSIRCVKSNEYIKLGSVHLLTLLTFNFVCRTTRRNNISIYLKSFSLFMVLKASRICT